MNDVCIRGAGVVGMSLALALSRQGLSVALQGLRGAAVNAASAANAASPAPGVSAPPGADVRTYALNARSVALLQALKVWQALPEDARTAVHDMRIEGDAPPGVLGFSSFEQAVDVLAWIVDAAELESVLTQAVRLAPHVTVLEAGPPVPAALQALCEGRDSASRAELGVRVYRRAYGHTAIAARLVASEAHAGLARQWFRCPDVLALLPFDRPQRGHSYGLVWSLPDERARELLALSPADFEQALAQATGGAAGTLQLASERASWPLELAHAEPVCGPGWVLLGDAAHRVHPLAGQGLNLGLADVECLARVISQRESFRALGDEKLLQRHARERWLPTRAMGAVTDGLLRLFEQPSPVWRQARNRGLACLDALRPLKRLLTERALHS